MSKGSVVTVPKKVPVENVRVRSFLRKKSNVDLVSIASKLVNPKRFRLSFGQNLISRPNGQLLHVIHIRKAYISALVNLRYPGTLLVHPVASDL